MPGNKATRRLFFLVSCNTRESQRQPQLQFKDQSMGSQYINPLPVQFKSLLHGHEGCVSFSGHLNLCTCQYIRVRLASQATFKSSTFLYVRAGKGLKFDEWDNRQSSKALIYDIIISKNFVTTQPIYRAGTPLPSKHTILFFFFNKFMYKIFQTLSVFSSSKCRLFHNSTLFGFCIIHILNTGCAKI
jgi:hypothetical protein